MRTTAIAHVLETCGSSRAYPFLTRDGTVAVRWVELHDEPSEASPGATLVVTRSVDDDGLTNDLSECREVLVTDAEIRTTTRHGDAVVDVLDERADENAFLARFPQLLRLSPATWTLEEDLEDGQFDVLGPCDHLLVLESPAPLTWDGDGRVRSAPFDHAPGAARDRLTDAGVRRRWSVGEAAHAWLGPCATEGAEALAPIPGEEHRRLTLLASRTLLDLLFMYVNGGGEGYARTIARGAAAYKALEARGAWPAVIDAYLEALPSEAVGDV